MAGNGNRIIEQIQYPAGVGGGFHPLLPGYFISSLVTFAGESIVAELKKVLK